MDALWNEAVLGLERAGNGFVSLIAREVTLLSFENDTLVGGLPRSKEFEFNLLKENVEDLQRSLGKIHGKPVRLQVEVRDDVPEKSSAFEDDQTMELFGEGPPVDPPPGTYDSADDDAAAADVDEEDVSPSAGATAPATVEPEPELESPEEFYSDPLINKALELFEGEILKESRS